VRLLADMGVSTGVVEWLRASGHDAIHLREEGLERLSDRAVFEKARNEDRVVLTFDLDFGEIAALAGNEAVGVVLFRLHNTRSANVIRRLAAAIESCSAALADGAVVLVEETRLRVRRFPGHGDSRRSG